jgi:transcriptional regulator with XRE-family HTH domain
MYRRQSSESRVDAHASGASRVCLVQGETGTLQSVSEETVGGRIQAARKAAGMTQRKLAEAVDTDSVTISRYERGDIADPRSGMLRAIAQALSVSFEWIATGREAPASSSAPVPPGWEEFLTRRPDLAAKFAEDELVDIMTFAARYHRAKSWADFETVVLRVLDSRPSEIFEEKVRTRKKPT